MTTEIVMTMERPLPRADKIGLTIAAVLLALTALTYWDATFLSINWGYDPGPKAAPFAVAFGLVVLAIANAILAVKDPSPVREQVDLRAIVIILGGLGGMIAILATHGGFIPAMAFLFATTAAGFGRRAFFTDLTIGFVVASAAYLLFSKLLTLSLPIGPLERLI